MVMAADYPLRDILGTMFVFFGFVIWFWLLTMVYGDLFRRSDMGGWAKFFWSVFVLVVPLLGVLIYLIATGGKSGARDSDEARARRAESDTDVRETAGNGGPGNEIAQAKQLLDSGEIDQAEFDAIKQKALA